MNLLLAKVLFYLCKSSLPLYEGVFTAPVFTPQSNRVTLKMDVSHTEHSHVIGKGGNNIKRVMEETGCHIHFPDSNRNNQAEKSNQVWLGPVLQLFSCQPIRAAESSDDGRVVPSAAMLLHSSGGQSRCLVVLL